MPAKELKKERVKTEKERVRIIARYVVNFAWGEQG
jgi:hypothetical protein